jgi:hypothetical protein
MVCGVNIAVSSNFDDVSIEFDYGCRDFAAVCFRGYAMNRDFAGEHGALDARSPPLTNLGEGQL